jgi:hypothetical protein
VKLFVGESAQILSGIFLRQKAKKRSSPLLNLRSMSFDCHSVGNLSVARDYGARSAVHMHDAQATPPERFHPLVITDRWNFDVERPQGLENREALVKFVRLAVDR